MNEIRDYLSRLSRINNEDYQDEGTQAHLHALALPLDELLTRARTALLARLVLYAPEEALVLLGVERGMTRYPNETLEAFRNRVANAFELWTMAGTVPGLLFGLKQLGWDAVVTEHFRDLGFTHRHEFSVTITNYPSSTEDAPRWGAFHWGDGTHWGGRQGQDMSTILALIRDLKPAHARLRTLTLQTTPLPIWGAFDWGDGTHWGGVIAVYNNIPDSEAS